DGRVLRHRLSVLGKSRLSTLRNLQLGLAWLRVPPQPEILAPGAVSRLWRRRAFVLWHRALGERPRRRNVYERLASRQGAARTIRTADAQRCVGGRAVPGLAAAGGHRLKPDRERLRRSPCAALRAPDIRRPGREEGKHRSACARKAKRVE